MSVLCPDGNPEIISNSSIYIFLLTFFEHFEDLKATYENPFSKPNKTNFIISESS